MKKKFLTFLFAICLIVPCAFLFSACGNNSKKAVSVTIDFAMDDDWSFGEGWTIDETTNTYTATYMNSFVWRDYMFEVVATTENGDTRHLYEATESNPMGYKIDTDMPDTEGRLPVGTYTFRLYCEDFDNGKYKAEACESETYTIIIEKEPIRVEGYEWHYNTTPNTFIDENTSISVSLDAFATFLGTSYISPGEVGITNFRYVDEAPYTREETNAGDYTAKVEYDADTANFEYDHLPEKIFEWSIEKQDLTAIVDNIWNSFEDAQFSIQYNHGNEIVLIYDADSLNQYLQFHTDVIKVTGFKVNGIPVDGERVSVTDVGEYTVQPIITQYKTDNYEIIDVNDPKYSRTWTITKKQFNASDFYWEDNIMPYHGWPQQVAFRYPSDAGCFNIQPVTDIDNNITFEATNAGTYTAKVTFDYDEDLYEIIGTIPLEYEWTIPKAELTFENANWHINYSDKTEIAYPESYYLRPQVSSVGDQVTYTHYDSQGKVVSSDSYLECGTYKTIATVDYDTNNYYLGDTSKLEYEWTVVKGNYYINWADWKYYSDINTTNEIEIEGNNITLQTLASGNYYIYLDLMTTPSFNFKYSFDDGQTFVEQGYAPSVNATVAGTYTITIVIEEQDLEHYNPIDATTFTLNVNIVEV